MANSNRGMTWPAWPTVIKRILAANEGVVMKERNEKITNEDLLTIISSCLVFFFLISIYFLFIFYLTESCNLTTNDRRAEKISLIVDRLDTISFDEKIKSSGFFLLSIIMRNVRRRLFSFIKTTSKILFRKRKNFFIDRLTRRRKWINYFSMYRCIHHPKMKRDQIEWILIEEKRRTGGHFNVSAKFQIVVFWPTFSI